VSLPIWRIAFTLDNIRCTSVDVIICVLIAGDVILDDTVLGTHSPRPYSCWRCVVY
jgi:hypothetical protein